MENQDPQNQNTPQNPEQNAPVQNQQSQTPGLQTPGLASQGETLEGYDRKLPLPKYIFLGIVFVVLLVIIAAAYFLGKNSSNNSVPIPSPAPVVYQSPSPTPNPTADWKTYTNSEDGYSVKFPQDWQIISDCNKGSVVEENFCFISPDYNAPNGPLTKSDQGGAILFFKGTSIRKSFKCEVEDALANYQCNTMDFGQYKVIERQNTNYPNFKEAFIQDTINHKTVNLIVYFNPQSKDEINIIFNTLISTFKFTQ